MMSTTEICKDGASSKSDDDVCEVNDMLHNMNTVDSSISKCANCGKEGDDVNNICNKCKLVKYCNASCKKKHRHKHREDCEEHLRITAELAAKLHDEKLFKKPPPFYEDCPICFLQMPTLLSGSRYMGCCGKVICSGCIHAPVYDNQGNKGSRADKSCPFCRNPAPTSIKEMIEVTKKRVDAGDAEAICMLGSYYSEGDHGFTQDYTKALELWHRAADLEYAEAYNNIGTCYGNGEGVEVDSKKAMHYYELAAMMGNETARNNLGINEENAGNYKQALRHYLIAVSSGNTESLNTIKEMYSNGFAIKEDYMKALQTYQAYLKEIKSKQRDEAATFDNERYKYY